MPRGKKKQTSEAPHAASATSAAASSKAARDTPEPSARGTSAEMPTVALSEGLALKEEGNKLFKDGEYSGAIRKYKQGILRTRGLVTRTSAMAMFAVSRGVAPLTEEEEFELVRLTQSLHANLSACYLKKSEWDKAVRYAAVVLDSDPGNVKSMLRLGQAYNQLGDLVGADRILTKAASLHTRPDALGKALRETLREVRTKLRSRDVHRGPSSAASAMSGSGADAGSAESEGRGYDDAGEDAADDDDDASAEPSMGTEVGEDGEDGVVSPAAEA